MAVKRSDYTLVQGEDKTPWSLFVPANAPKDWAVLWLQGFTSTIEGHAEGVIRMSEQSNTTFAILNYAGHGTHPTPLDEATRAQQFSEVCGVYDEIAAQGYKHIIAIGGSFGGYMAALLSGHHDLAGVVLRAPAIYRDSEFEMPYAETQEKATQEQMDLYREDITVDSPSAALDAVRNYKGDTFVIEHELDKVVNRAVPQAYFGVAQHPNYIVIRGCEHSPKLMANPAHFFGIIEQWIATTIRTLQIS